MKDSTIYELYMLGIMMGIYVAGGDNESQDKIEARVKSLLNFKEYDELVFYVKTYSERFEKLVKEKENDSE